MYSEKQIVRRGELIERLIRAVSEYYGAFGAPMPMKALSAKYGKALNCVGGFVETIDTLFQDGTLDIILMRSGGKAVYPGGTLCILKQDEAFALKRG